MAGGGGFGVSALVQNQGVPSSSQPLDGFFISGSSSSFMGPSSMVSFQDVCGATRSERLLFCTFDQDDDGDDDLDEYAHQPGKKRRLSMDQVRFLERSFEAENKLEPDRKIQLAKELSLQPRQVAIWFQNRRARWKTKQLEKDYDALQVSFTSLKTDYDNLLKEKETLKAEVVHLADKLQLKAKQHEDSNPANMDHVLQLPPQDPVLDSASDGEAPQAQVQAHAQEDLSPTKSDEFDSGSPHYIDGGHSSFGDSSYGFEPDQSDISQDDADNLSKNLLPFAYVFPRIEDVEYPDPPSTSCNFGFPIEDHASWFWSY